MPPHRITLSEVGCQNVVYSDAEQIVIRNELKTAEAGLLRLGTLRNNRADRQRQLKDQIYRCKVALAPYQNIPNEIWMYILELYCQSAGRLSTCDRGQPPVVLSQVCSAWRHVVLSMPKLWSDVHLDQDVGLAKIWLERAGNIPRSLETSTPKSHRHFNFNRPQKIQSFLYSFPFRKLHITQRDAAGIDFRAIPVESLLPVEDLGLLKPALDAPDLGVTYLSPHQFPNLMSLQIDTTIMPRFHVSRPFTTWKKLRVLRLECELERAKCREILCDASSVEDCSLGHISMRSYQNPNPTGITVVANLKILRLSFSSAVSLWSFLGHFTFPNLDTLIITPRISVNFYPYGGLVLPYRAPHIGALRSLNINHLFREFDVASVLRCLPVLQVLELNCAKVTRHIVEKIGRGELGGCLRELYDWSSSNLYEFLRVCELRRDVTQSQSTTSSGAIARLEKISVIHSPSVLDCATDCERRIRKLREDGIEFKVMKPSAVNSTSGCT